MKTLIQAAVVTLFAASTAQAQEAVQWRVEDGGNGHWYLGVRTAQPLSWTQARSATESAGGHLATAINAAEFERIKAIAGAPGLWTDRVGPWLGGYQDRASPEYSEPLGGWRWVTGETWYEQWIPGEPNNARGGEDFLHFISHNCTDPLPTRHWNDYPDQYSFDSCSPVPSSYIIEWSADCNADGIVDYGQVLQGQLSDANSNNIPDRCECGAVPTLPACCLGDLNADRTVDGADLGALLFAWGPAVPQSPADLDGDGQVGGADLGLLLFGWGACPVFTPPWATLVEAQPDPAVVTDPALRAAISATGLAWRVQDTGTQIEMLLVPPGTFQMGCIMGSNQYGCYTFEQPVHQVTLTNAFYLGRYEMTQAQWQATMGSNPSSFQSASTQVPAAHVPNRPVEWVSWNAVQDYLNSTGMRLPTEAEWEYACRAGTPTPFYNGSTDDSTLDALTWYSANSGNQTRPVGGKAANAFGFHDMLGNVWEWVNDWYGGYSANAQTNPTGPVSGSHRVIRGGSWTYYGVTDVVRSSYRYLVAGYPDADLGFRVARNP